MSDETPRSTEVQMKLAHVVQESLDLVEAWLRTLPTTATANAIDLLVRFRRAVTELLPPRDRPNP